MLLPRPLVCIASLTLLASVGAGLAAPAAPSGSEKSPARGAASPNPKGGDREEWFEVQVRPVLARRCGACHGPEKPAAGLDLSTGAALLKGGSRGAALLPGKPEESLLYRAITHAAGVPRMPPSGRMPENEIAALREWIRAGAYWPEVKKAGTDGPLWSVQPLKKTGLPSVRNAVWARNPIDAFILAKLEAQGMKPAPPAGDRELIRRVSYDLTGLPASPEEVERFVRSRSAERAARKAGARRGGGGVISPAYEKLVDRLLASPRYGERWARYWLDLVRYADSNGYERDAEKPYSWKYRDYVIDSLNRDVPYDRFVLEQLAGDELPGATEKTLVATGFLRLGTWDDEPNDPLEYQYERLDDLVHATSTAFLGLTVRCARCHDHKFDPIPQKDYYALGAAFWGGYLQPADRKYLGGPPPERLGKPLLGFTDRGREAPPLHLLQNGDPRRQGPVVDPAFVSALPVPYRAAEHPDPAAGTTGRRLALARAIVDPRNPLTPRVIVNRLWQHHFGQGLVRTPNNFGRKGSPPTHPELLDWLASWFASPAAGGGQYGSMGAREYGSRNLPNAQGPRPNADTLPHTPTRPHPHTAPSGADWSLKKLHRLILTSSTYQMASVHPEQTVYARRDYENQLWWRFNRRRLDADALRDSLLAVSGQLNPAMGGRGFTPDVPREALEGLSRKGAEWEVSAPEEQRRRSIYMFLKRALIMPFMTAFDFADTTQPLEQRESAVVPPQALALMNNRFAHQQSRALARRVIVEAGESRPRQVDRLWRLALGRPPDSAERAASLRHLERIGGRPQPAKGREERSPPARDPDAEPVLRLWLRADRGVITDEQGRVSGWKDLSRHGHDLVQESPAARPVLAPAGFRGKPALRFDGSGRFLSVSGQPITSPAFTIVALAADRGGGGPREIFSNWRRDENVGTSVFLGTTGTGVVRFSDVFAPAGTLSRPDEPLILTAVTDPGGARVYQDRRLLAERTAGLPDRNLTGPYVIGQQGNIGGEYWTGDLAELLVYDRALAPDELAGVWDYLGKRYGIAARPEPEPPTDAALASLCHVLLNSNEFIYVD